MTNLEHLEDEEVLGTSGSDAIFSRASGGVIDGGGGEDRVHLERQSYTGFLSLDMSLAATSDGYEMEDGTVIKNTERLYHFYAGSGGSFVNGSSTTKAGWYVGGSGSDTFIGGSDGDLFRVGTNDAVFANGGRDYIEVRGSGFTVDGGSGIDTLRIVGAATFGVNSITNIENITVADGATSFDWASGAGERISFNNLFNAPGTLPPNGQGIVVKVSSVTPKNGEEVIGSGVNILGSGLNDRIAGGAGDDHIDGGRGDDALNGGEGSDRLDGGSGGDRLFGEGGNDFLYSKNPDGYDIVLDGGTGYDFAWIERTHETLGYVVDVSSTSATIDSLGMHIRNLEEFIIEGGSGDDSVKTGDGDDKLYGNAGSDTLSGGAGSDYLDGGIDADMLIGGIGDDTFVVDNLGDVVFEAIGGGIDTVISSVSFALQGTNVENLTLTGSAYSARGSVGDNHLIGNDLNNLIDPGWGSDFMVGGGGADSFVFEGIGLGDQNVIGDFESGIDKIYLESAAFAGSMEYGAPSSDHFVVGTAATQVFGQFIFDTSTGTLYWDPDGTGADAAVEIVTVDGAALSANDLFAY